MQNAIQPQIFINDALGCVIRIFSKDGMLWFIAKDVCRTLDLNNVTEALRGLDEDEKFQLSSNIINPELGGRGTFVISEPGLYSLILRSRKPEAKLFKRWVTHEVLPAIRKTGGYGKPVDLQTIFSFLNEERQARIRFEKTLYERLVPTKALAGAATPSLDEIRARILNYVITAGVDGLPRRTLSNRIRQNTERKMAVASLLSERILLEVLRDGKRYLVCPSAFSAKQEKEHGI